MKTWWRLLLVAFAGLGCVVLLGLLALFLLFGSGRGVPTFPRVRITSSLPEGTGVVNHAVVVFGEASDPDGIGSAELWVNGNIVSSQANPDSGQSPFDISESWIPDGPGSYLFLLRGIDRKGFSAQSDPVMIQVVARSDQPNLTSQEQYIVQQGDTLASVAARFATTPDAIRALNPGLGDLTPGASIFVPPAPDSAATAESPPAPPGGGAAAPPAGGSDAPPHASPAPAPSPAGGAPAEPVRPPWWSYLPLPGLFDCVLSPAACASPVGDAGPALAASDVHATLADACSVSVSWTDNASNEFGFRVYRLVMRPRFRSDLLALLAPAPGSGTRLTYVDAAAPSGQFYYVIATVNARGEEVWSGLSEELTTTCPSRPSLVGSSFDVEALGMTVGDSSIDRLYCYLSLAGSPFERIPHGASEFITLEGGAWNIAAYASGDNKRTLMLDGTTPLEIVADCLGRQGDTLIDLGRFTRSHPPAEWDGRMLTAGPDLGAFNVTYRIQPTPAISAGTTTYGIDPTVPVPFNLRATETWTRCALDPGGILGCSMASEPGLAWDYDAAAPRPLYYKVYSRPAGSSTTTLSYTTGDSHRSAPRDECQPAFYSVSAVVAVEPGSGEETESPPSEALETPATCGQLEITLVDMYVYGGGHDGYGLFSFSGVPVIWNLGPCAGGTLCGGAPSYTSVSRTTVYNWADMFLSVARGGFGRGHNVFRVPIHDGEPLRMTFQLWDHYVVGSDEVWCGYFAHRAHNIMAARSLTEWLTVDQDLLAFDGSTVPLATGAIGCQLNIHVRGIP